MVAENYSASLKRVLVHEGGFSNHPNDPGGATQQGVTQRVYDGYRDRRDLQRQSVRLISQQELGEIYSQQYATPIRFSDLPLGVDYVVFDGAVNSGPQQSVKWLQRALGVNPDGIVGNVTLSKVRDHPDHGALVDAICSQRFRFLQALKTWKTFGKGWTSRVNQVRDAAHGMIEGAPSAPVLRPLAMDIDLASMPAIAADLAKPSAPVVVPTIGSAGGALAGVSLAIEQGKEQLLPFVGTLPIVGHVLTGLTVLGITIAIGGLAYGAWAKRRRDRIKAVA